jgi:hypothetical protein
MGSEFADAEIHFVLGYEFTRLRVKLATRRALTRQRVSYNPHCLLLYSYSTYPSLCQNVAQQQ